MDQPLVKESAREAVEAVDNLGALEYQEFTDLVAGLKTELDEYPEDEAAMGLFVAGDREILVVVPRDDRQVYLVGFDAALDAFKRSDYSAGGAV
jgi:hypothetical protein